MNLEDQIGFVVVIDSSNCLGVTIEQGQFIHFSYEGSGKKGVSHQVLEVAGLDGEMLGNFKQVIQVISRRKDELFIVATSEACINVFQLIYANPR